MKHEETQNGVTVSVEGPARPTKSFSKKVDRRSKESMARFLAEHFRYDTMNGWNRTTSYAHDVKIYGFVPRDLQDKAFDLLQVDDAYDEINMLISEFDSEHDHRWQVGFNGRSSGYLVLYQGGKKPSENKRQCHDCWQKNYRADSTKCGRCGGDNMHDYKGWEYFTQPGLGTDENEDFESFMEWDISSLRSRVELVQEFDELVDKCAQAFVTLCENSEVVEETYFVPQTRMVLA